MCNHHFYRFLFRSNPRHDTHRLVSSQNGKMLTASMSAAAVLYASVISSTTLFSSKPADAAQLRHHVPGGKGFMNPWDSYVDLTPGQIGKAFFSRILSGKSKSPDITPPTVPVQRPQFLQTRETPALRTTWLGHASYLVEFPSGLRVLFDPVFEDRCGPSGILGPKRFTEPPCELEEIPFIDAVVISHSHYDHMSLPSLQRIQKSHPNAQFFAPLGNQQWFQDNGILHSQEMDWWDTKTLNLTKVPNKANVAHSTQGQTEISDAASGPDPNPETIDAVIGCLPSQHMAARTPFDRGKTLWSSWFIESGGKKVWFAGDTGYRSVPELPDDVDDYSEPYKNLPRCPAFAQIGELRGPFDLGLIPIGAYFPRYMFSALHANPFDSVEIFKATGCKRALAMHWGTWVLTEEAVMEPPKLLRQALARSGIAEEGVFDVCNIGESREF